MITHSLYLWSAFCVPGSVLCAGKKTEQNKFLPSLNLYAYHFK